MPKRYKISLAVGWKVARVGHQGSEYGRLEKWRQAVVKHLVKIICDNVEERLRTHVICASRGSGWKIMVGSMYCLLLTVVKKY